MKPKSLTVVADFLEAHFEAFQFHLENEFEIEATEAEVIIDELKKEAP